MKKKLSLLLVAMMTLVMALPVMAAPSPAAKGVVNEIKASKDKNGNDVKVSIRETEELFAEVPEELKAVYTEAVKNVTDKATAKKTVEDAILASVKPEEMADFLKEFKTEYKDAADLASKVEVVDVKDVHVDDPTSVEWPLAITFEVPGVTVDSTIVVLHHTGIDWESVPVSILGDGQVEASFDSLSPVAFVVDKATLADAKEEVEEKEEVKEEAPAEEEVVEEPAKESSNTMIYVIVVIALIAVVAVIFLKKKNK